MPSPSFHEREAYWKARAEQLPFYRFAAKREAQGYVAGKIRRRMVGRVALGSCAFVLGWGALGTQESTCPSVNLDAPPAELQLTSGPSHVTPATELQLVPSSR